MGGWVTIRCPSPGCAYRDDFRLESDEATDPGVLSEHQQILHAEHPHHLAHDRASDPLDDALPTCPRCLQSRELARVGDELWWICDCGVEPAA
jgi:hypothetical protein